MTTKQFPIDRLGLDFLVFVTGAAVMILEVLGTRLIGPYYGVTLYVWTALIFVTLISLALGYYCGGALADRRPGTNSMVAVTLVAAALILLIPLRASAVLASSSTWGVRWGTLVSALILFGPPLFFLAMVGPCAVKVRTARLDQVGSAVGSLYGISTVGSCVGTLLVAYVLLPRMPTYSILYLVCASLSVAAGFYLLIARKYRGAALAGVMLSLALLKMVFGLAPIPQVQDGFRVLFRAESVYGRVQVVDDAKEGIRWLMSDGSVVGAEYLDGRGTVYPFLRMMEAVRYLYPSGCSALQIGLGTGAVPKLFTTVGIRTDVVEIDGNVARAARDYFDFRESGDLFIEDGRRFLRRVNRRYDFVIHDTFTGGTVPFHLLSRQVFLDIRRILVDDGVLCLAFVGYFSGDKALAVESIFRTLSAVFRDVRLVADPDSALLPSTLLFFASSGPLPWAPEQWIGLGKATQVSLINQQKKFSPSKGLLITDELNALDLWQLDKSESYRNWIIEAFPARILLD